MAFGLFVVTAVVYGVTAARHLQGGDAGEFALISASGGYAHPPGYPLFSMYLQTAEWLPAASPAHAASLATAGIGAAAVGCTYLALRAWQRSPAASVLCALGFAFAADIWLHHTLPEVFALNHLIAAVIVGLSSPWLNLPGRLRVFALGLLGGLGLSNHLTIIFVAPVAGYAAWRAVRNHPETENRASQPMRRYVTAIGVGCLGVLSGLLPYLYVLGEHAGAWRWGDIESASGVVELMLRMDYGVLSMTAGESAGPFFDLIAFWASSVTIDLVGVYALAALAALEFAGRRTLTSPPTPEDSDSPNAENSTNGEDDDHRLVVGILVLGGALMLAGPVFGAMLSRSPDGLSRRIMRRMHLLSEFMAFFLAAFGFDLLRRYISQRLSVVLAGLVVVTVASVGWLHVTERHTPTVEHYILDSRDALPADTVLIGTADHRFFGHLYADLGLNHRADVTYIDAYLTAYPWYRERLGEKLGREVPGPDQQSGDIDLPKLVRAVAELGRPVCITHPIDDSLTNNFVWLPVGTSMCRPTDGLRAPPIETYGRQLEWLKSARNRPPIDVPAPSWAHETLGHYARNWRTLADALKAQGHETEATRADKLAEEYE